MWFAAKSTIARQPWLQRFVLRLLDGDRRFASLLAFDPFPGDAPVWIKADLYLYEMAGAGEQGWWKRSFVRPYFEPVRKPSG
jgi:hypothetical protein